MEDPILEGGSDFIIIEELDNRDIGNDYPCSFGKRVTGFGIDVPKRQHDWPSLLPSRKVC
jgi:hypothetical protein